MQTAKTTADGKKLLTWEDLDRLLQDDAYIADLEAVSRQTAEHKKGFIEHAAAVDAVHAKRGYANTHETFQHCMTTTPMDPATRISLMLMAGAILYASSKRSTPP
jgi:hypothetical protein